MGPGASQKIDMSLPVYTSEYGKISVRVSVGLTCDGLGPQTLKGTMPINFADGVYWLPETHYDNGIIPKVWLGSLKTTVRAEVMREERDANERRKTRIRMAMRKSYALAGALGSLGTAFGRKAADQEERDEEAELTAKLLRIKQTLLDVRENSSFHTHRVQMRMSRRRSEINQVTSIVRDAAGRIDRKSMKALFQDLKDKELLEKLQAVFRDCVVGNRTRTVPITRFLTLVRLRSGGEEVNVGGGAEAGGAGDGDESQSKSTPKKMKAILATRLAEKTSMAEAADLVEKRYSEVHDLSWKDVVSTIRENRMQRSLHRQGSTIWSIGDPQAHSYKRQYKRLLAMRRIFLEAGRAIRDGKEENVKTEEDEFDMKELNAKSVDIGEVRGHLMMLAKGKERDVSKMLAVCQRLARYFVQSNDMNELFQTYEKAAGGIVLWGEFYAIAAQGFDDALAAEKKVQAQTSVGGANPLDGSRMEIVTVYSSDLYPVDKEKRDLADQDRIELALEAAVSPAKSRFLRFLPLICSALSPIQLCSFSALLWLPCSGKLLLTSITIHSKKKQMQAPLI